MFEQIQQSINWCDFSYFLQKIGFNQGEILHEMSNSIFSENKMFSAEILARMLNVIQNSDFNTCNDELLLHSKTEDQAQPMHLHSLNWIFYGLFLFTCIFYSIHYVVSGQSSWTDWIMIDSWENDVISFCSLPQNKRKKRDTMFTLYILTPYHTCSTKKITRPFYYLLMYLKLLDKCHSVTALIIIRLRVLLWVHPGFSDFG